MKVSEFVKMYGKSQGSALKALDIKEYLGIAKKYLIAKSIVNAVVDYDDNGVAKVDSFQLKMIMFRELMEAYTALEIGADEIMPAYDALYSCGALADIRNRIQGEEKEIKDLTYQYLNDKLNYENDPAKILGEIVSVVLDSLNTTTASLIDTVSGALANVDVKQIEGLLKKIK